MTTGDEQSVKIESSAEKTLASFPSCNIILLHSNNARK